MSEIPGDLKFNKLHEWIRFNTDGSMTVGITDYAQQELGDLVYVDLPEEGSSFDANECCAVVESVKAASDIIMPMTGEIVEVNDLLNESPELINEDCYGDGWIFRIKAEDEGEYFELLDADDYSEEIGQL